MNETIQIHDVMRILKKRWKIMILTILIGAMISAGVTYYLLEPVYQATTQILVNQRDSENALDVNLLQRNRDLINTYSVIIKSPIITNKVIEKLNLDEDIKEINKKTSITSFDNSLVFSLTVEDHDPSKAIKMANTISEIFQQEIKGIMNVDNVNIIARAEKEENPVPIFPNPLLNITIGTFIGILLGLGLAILLENMNKTLKDGEEVEGLLGLPVIGTIGKIPKNINKKDAIIIQKIRGETLES